jgi:hypothetical protein
MEKNIDWKFMKQVYLIALSTCCDYLILFFTTRLNTLVSYDDDKLGKSSTMK